jgi:glycosyltransferase involved in cell wall biosynthesis
MNKKYHILVCDVNVRPQGHYIGYNQYILEKYAAIEKDNRGVCFSFLYNREAEKLLTLNKEAREKVSYIDLNERNTALNRYLIVREIKKYTKANKIDHLLFMDLDQYQLPFYFIDFDLHISAILFRPHHRIESSNDSFIELILTRFRRLKKRFAEKLVVDKTSVQNIFILNDSDGVRKLNKFHNSSVFKFLPDPVFSYIHQGSAINLPSRDTDPYRFLIFGSMSERKNINNIVQAYNKADFLRKTELLIVGPGSEDFLVQLNNMIDRLETIDGNHKSIRIHNAFVPNEEMDYYFSTSDVCLLIYKDFFGSSGVLGRAAFHKLKVIGPNTGLLNELIRRYRMGITADPRAIDSIARSLHDVIKFDINPNDLESFYVQHTPDSFLDALAESVTP